MAGPVDGHGRRIVRTVTELRERRARVTRALQVAPLTPTRQLAQQFGLDDTTVSRIRRQLAHVQPPGGYRFSPAGRLIAPHLTPTHASPRHKLEQYDRMRQMAADGHSSAQIAAAIGMTLPGCRARLKQLGVTAHADKVMRGKGTFSADRVLEGIVGQVEGLVDDVRLIDFRQLKPAQVSHWLRALEDTRAGLTAVIKQLRQRQGARYE